MMFDDQPFDQYWTIILASMDSLPNELTGRTVQCKKCLETLESSRLMKAFVLKMLKYFADFACFN